MSSNPPRRATPSDVLDNMISLMLSQAQTPRNNSQNPEHTRDPTARRIADAQDKLKEAQDILFLCEQGVASCEEIVKDAMIEFEMAGERFISSGGTVRTETALDSAMEKLAEEQERLLVVRRGIMQAKLEVKDAQGDFDAAVGVDGRRN